MKGILVALTFALYSVHGFVPLLLSGPAGELTLSTGNESIPEGYQTARLECPDPDTLWIIYDVMDYNSANLNRHAEIVQGDTDVDFGSDILSAQPFDVMRPGVILFRHLGYGVPSLVLTDSGSMLPDDEFPAGRPAGLSELIVTGGVWTLYTNYNYTGAISVNGTTQLGPGSYPLEESAADAARSIELVA